MSENKENKAIENNNSALQRPGSTAGMSPEIVEPKEIKETKESENKAPRQDIDSPFKAAPAPLIPTGPLSEKKQEAVKSEAVKAEDEAKKKSKKKKADNFSGMTEEEA